MTPKPIEPMPLDEVRERLRYTATSQVSTLEPADVARMLLTVEALVGALADVIDAWDGRHPMVRADEVVDRARQFVGPSKVEPCPRCPKFDYAAHYRGPQCELLEGHEGECLFRVPE